MNATLSRITMETPIGLLSIVAVRLLQLKTIATKQPDLPAASIVPCTADSTQSSGAIGPGSATE